MFEPGDVILYKDYEFVNPITGLLEGKVTKRFIVLNSDPCLVLKTTSQSRHYPNAKPGCQQKLKTFMISGSQEPCFYKDTYVQLPQIIQLPKESLDVRVYDGRIKVLQKPGEDCFRAIKLCLKQFKQDISPSNWERIF